MVVEESLKDYWKSYLFVLLATQGLPFGAKKADTLQKLNINRMTTAGAKNKQLSRTRFLTPKARENSFIYLHNLSACTPTIFSNSNASHDSNSNERHCRVDLFKSRLVEARDVSDECMWFLCSYRHCGCFRQIVEL